MTDPQSTPPSKPTKQLTRPSEATEAHDAAPVDLGTPEVGGLYKLARTQPFMRNYYRCAHARFASRATPETRVSKMIELHPRWYQFCWWADAALLGLTVALVLAVAGIAIYKTILA